MYMYVATDATGSGYASPVGNNMYVSFPQAESLPFATSYIPTTSSAVTRADEACYIDGLNNIGRINNGFTILMDVERKEPDNFKYYFSNYSSVGLDNSFIGIHTYVSNRVSCIIQTPTTSERVYSNIDSFKIGDKVRVGFTYDGTSMSIYIDGLLHSTVAVTGVYGINYGQFNIGSLTNSVSHTQTNNSRIKIYDYSLSATEIALS